ncbi:MAG: amidohydrolase family protein [Pseudomonadota bacterium]
MTKVLVRGRTVVRRVKDREASELIPDGAVLVEGAEIAAVGPFEALRRAHPDAPVLGSERHIVLPGLVNAHHHVGLTPVQLGSLDEPLEMWAITRMAARTVDPYLDTLYSAFEMLESGVTTVQHIFAWVHRDIEAVRQRIEAILKAYEDVGMRVSFSVAVRDQNHSMLLSDEQMLAGVPAGLRPRLAARFAEFTVPLADQIALFEDLYRFYDGHPLIAIQLAPGNLHWCSDRALEDLQEAAERHNVPLHIHLLETVYQKEYARRRTGGTALAHLDRFGMTGRHVTIGHGVWMNEEDIELAADTGTHICHNCSSNLRLRSGILPLNRLLRQGLNLALGIDEAGLNDDRDMLQEMRLVLRLHREPGMDGLFPSAHEVLRMATEGGAMTTPFAGSIGALEPGRQADLFLVDWSALSAPFLDRRIGPVDGILNRAKAAHVEMVMVAGRPVVERGGVTSVDKPGMLRELARSLAYDADDAELSRIAFAGDLYEPVRDLYSNYIDPSRLRPFYAANSRR